jgi:hypothetical protein
VIWGSIQQRVLYNLGKQGSGANAPNADVLAQIVLWAEEFQKEYQNDRNYWFMKATAERLITNASQQYEFPPGYKEGLIVYIRDPVNDQWIELYPISSVDAIRLYTPTSNPPQDQAEPINYELGNTSMTFWPWPDVNYYIRCQYWGDLTLPAVAGNLSDPFVNYWMDRFPRLYIAGISKAGFRYLRNWESADQWEKIEMKLIADVRAMNVSRMMESDKSLKARASVYGSSIDVRMGVWSTYYY